MSMFRAMMTIGFFTVFQITLVLSSRLKSNYFDRSKDMDNRMLIFGVYEQVQVKRRLICVSRCLRIKNCCCSLYNRFSYQCRLYDLCIYQTQSKEEIGWECWSPPTSTREVSYKYEYVLSTDTLKWHEALSECQWQGKTLAIVDTKEKNEIVEKLIRKRGLTDFVWLGGEDIDKEGEWEWINSQKMVFTMWSSYNNQPDDYMTQDCLAVIYRDPESYWNWFDKSCEVKHHYLCEKKIINFN